MDPMGPGLSPLPLLLFATALWLYPSVRILDTCCLRLSLAASADDFTEPFTTFEDSKPAIDGLGSDQAGLQTGNDNQAGHLICSKTPIETDFVDIEINARILSASNFVPETSSTQDIFGREELEQLLMFSDLDPQLSVPQTWIERSFQSFENHDVDKSGEMTCPCTPRIDFSGYVSPPDSGYHSQASPQSFFGAASRFGRSSVLSYGDNSENMYDKFDEIETESSQRTEYMEVQKLSSASGISLDLLVDYRGTGMSDELGITVLDRESGLHLPLRKALSTKDLRKRTGLLLSLHNICEKRELRVRELIPWEKLGSVKATISVWDRKHKKFEDLSTILKTSEARRRTNLCIGKCSSQLDRASSPRHPMSWPNLVEFLHLDGFYLDQLRDEGVNVYRQVGPSIGESTRLCIRTKLAA